MDIQSLYQLYLQNPTICTDTRQIKSGCLFFALKGENFDANTFALQALNDGAAYCIIDNEKYNSHKNCILVKDVLITLQELAKHHREQLNIPIIGLTGSNGKTTTKELIKAALGSQYHVFATAGNLNNHIGVPLSLLAIGNEVEIAIIEMGANHQKEIEFLCTLAQPTHGLISNVGLAHLDGFGGFEGVKKGKGELYAWLTNSQGTTFINKSNPILLEMAKTHHIKNAIYYGDDNTCLIKGELLHSDPFMHLTWQNNIGQYSLNLQITGAYNFENTLAAICIAQFFEVKPENINKGLANYSPTNNRSQIEKTETNTLICDFYNANPSSMTAAINNLKNLKSSHKVAILGDMFELGSESKTQHQLIAKQAQESQFDVIILIGAHFYTLKDDFEALFFETPEQAREYLTKHKIENSLVLLKGSRGMKLENLVQFL
ncbi:MAG: UDP-N-acetylmuramoyl-tripeptide--D-alanyl-D-alanine ligase [Sphingobacteriaceae bacterium]|nr:UDP-N-acetylmuramoyl-tripeptide--D-alanyl-D-alanine ligase [Sphingobacteriaceae bacterium]